jgi:hypothetical protein
MERASLARPTLSGWQRKTSGYVGPAVLVLVLVPEKWGWVGQVLEYCAKSELHPRSGFGMLTRRFVLVLLRNTG